MEQWFKTEQHCGVRKVLAYGERRNGCVGTDTIHVKPKQCTEAVFIPTAFTPNKDGKNDRFGPVVYGRTEIFSFQVFSRWGDLIFTSTDPSITWDGTIRGIPQPSGSYVWVCVYQLQGQDIKKEDGTVTLLR